VRGRKGEAQLFFDLRRQGYVRVRQRAAASRLRTSSGEDQEGTIEVVVDRLVVK
jgi:excinuclease UvrABC ATPase subunit